MEMRGMMGGFYRISEWIMRLSVTNLLWVITSLPFWYFFFFGVILPLSDLADPAEIYMGFLIAAVLAPFTLFPSTSAMFAMVRKWIMGDTDVPLFKTFFRSYKENYKISMLGGLFYAVVFVVIYTDIRWYLSGASGLELISYIFMGIAILLLVSLFNFFSMEIGRAHV